MAGWIAIGVLYVLNVAFLRWLGGVGAAGEAISRWGRAVADLRRGHTLSPSS
jgi:hypothetical protein